MTKHIFFIVGVFVLNFEYTIHAYAFTPTQIEKVVTRYFKDAPVMVEIARCESGLRHYLPDGNVLRGGAGGMMIGLFQLHEGYHRAPASHMGIDIDSLVGNILYARHLYEKSGVMPWRSCVPDIVAQRNSAGDANVRLAQHLSASVSQQLTFGARHPDVREVQKALVREGYLRGTYTIGQFDIPTTRALVQFQCKVGITCGNESSYAEYGVVGARTRLVLLGM